MKRNIGLWRVGAALIAGLISGRSAEAGYRILQNDASANAVTTAKVLVAPLMDDNTLRIKRIRVTNGASISNPSYRFFAKNTSDKEGDTEDLSSCTLPTCYEIAAVEAVQEGAIWDLTGLNISLMPGDRFYVFASANISADTWKAATIEVWYDE